MSDGDCVGLRVAVGEPVWVRLPLWVWEAVCVELGVAVGEPVIVWLGVWVKDGDWVGLGVAVGERVCDWVWDAVTADPCRNTTQMTKANSARPRTAGAIGKIMRPLNIVRRPADSELPPGWPTGGEVSRRRHKT